MPLVRHPSRPWSTTIRLVSLASALVFLSLAGLMTFTSGCRRTEREPPPPPIVKPEVVEKHITQEAAVPKVEPTPAPTKAVTAAKRQLPKLIDYGAATCTPCKMMAPILEELQSEYLGKVDVVVIDVRKDPQAGREANLRVIPTQVFIATDGRELFRHEGFYPKESIIAKWRQLGFEID